MTLVVTRRCALRGGWRIGLLRWVGVGNWLGRALSCSLEAIQGRIRTCVSVSSVPIGCHGIIAFFDQALRCAVMPRRPSKQSQTTGERDTSTKNMEDYSQSAIGKRCALPIAVRTFWYTQPIPFSHFPFWFSLGNWRGGSHFEKPNHPTQSNSEPSVSLNLDSW